MKNLKVSVRKKTRLRKAVRYWSKKNMKSAVPVPLRVAPMELMEAFLHTEESGPTQISLPVPPKINRMVAQTSEVTDMTAVPFRTVGKLFMREGSSNFVGSAWVVGKQAIFTAAHCLMDDNGTFFDDVVFQPQFKDGTSAGAFPVVQMAVDSRYLVPGQDADLRFDLGIAILDRPIGDLTGITGFVVNPTSQIAIGKKVTGVGYPAGLPFDGSKMFQSTGEVVRDSAPGTTTERFFGAENDMTGGCSGGPWFADNLAIGLNSFVFVGENPPIMHSPYLGQGFKDLIEWGEENGVIDPDSDDTDTGGDTGGGDGESVKDQLMEVAEKLTQIAGQFDD